MKKDLQKRITRITTCSHSLIQGWQMTLHPAGASCANLTTTSSASYISVEQAKLTHSSNNRSDIIKTVLFHHLTESDELRKGEPEYPRKLFLGPPPGPLFQGRGLTSLHCLSPWGKAMEVVRGLCDGTSLLEPMHCGRQAPAEKSYWGEIERCCLLPMSTASTSPTHQGRGA